MTQRDFPVLCGGARHLITLNSRGSIVLRDHDRELRAAEWNLAEAAGDLRTVAEGSLNPNGCYRVVAAWRRAIASTGTSNLRPSIAELLQDPIKRRATRHNVASRFLLDVTWTRAAIACWVAGNWITAALREVGLPTPPFTISLSRDHSQPVVWEERRPPIRIVIPGSWYLRVWHRAAWEQRFQHFHADDFDEQTNKWGPQERRLVSVDREAGTVTLGDGHLTNLDALTFSRGGPGVAQSIHGSGLRLKKGAVADVPGKHVNNACRYSFVPDLPFDRKRFNPGNGHYLPFGGDAELRGVRTAP